MDMQNALLNYFPVDDVFNPKMGKAVGLDGWSGELIKFLEPSLKQVLPYIFVLCLRSGVTPEQWDLDIKVPIPKPGKPLDKPNSLRPITLVNILMKQYEAWLLRQLDMFVSTAEHQAGFKPDYSCTGRLFLLSGLLYHKLHYPRSGVYAVFIDFSSFFDTIREELLCTNLLKRNVPAYLVRAIHGMLSEVKAQVLMKGTLGAPFQCKVGLRQGSRSSPKLATIFLDILTEALLTCAGGIELFGTVINHIFYADDLVLLFERWEETQHALNLLGRLCTSLGLHVSVEKSFVVFFSKRKKEPLRDLMYCQKALPMCDSAKYLGCTLNNRVKFDNHLKNVRVKADRAFSVLMNFQKRYPCLKFSEFLKLYYALVYPVFAYSSEVFVWCDGQEYDSIFIEHLRRYFNLPKTTSHQAIHFITATFPIQAKMQCTAYRFWKKIASLDENRFEKLVYRKMKADSSQRTWYTEMMSVFKEIGFEGDFCYWSSQWIQKENGKFTKCLFEHYTTKMKVWAKNSSYRTLVQSIDFENRAGFLDYSNFWERRFICKFFLRCYNFEMSTGMRHRMIPQERFCVYCIQNLSRVCLGDEAHYLESCPRFSPQRDRCCSILNVSQNELMNILCGKNLVETVPPSVYFANLARFIRTSFSHLADPFGKP